MGIAEVLAAGKALIEASKLARDLVNNPDFKADQVRATVQEMLIHLTNAQTGLAETQQENMTLRSQLDERAAIREIEADLDFVGDGGFYIRKSHRAQEIFCPLCPICWGNNQKLVPLTPMATGYYSCGIHETNYQTRAYREAEAKRREKALADESAFAVLPPRVR